MYQHKLIQYTANIIEGISGTLAHWSSIWWNMILKSVQYINTRYFEVNWSENSWQIKGVTFVRCKTCCVFCLPESALVIKVLTVETKENCVRYQAHWWRSTVTNCFLCDGIAETYLILRMHVLSNTDSSIVAQCYAYMTDSVLTDDVHRSCSPQMSMARANSSFGKTQSVILCPDTLLSTCSEYFHEQRREEYWCGLHWRRLCPKWEKMLPSKGIFGGSKLSRHV